MVYFVIDIANPHASTQTAILDAWMVRVWAIRRSLESEFLKSSTCELECCLDWGYVETKKLIMVEIYKTPVGPLYLNVSVEVENEYV